MAEVDHTSAQSAFVSLAFGLNTVFAFYKSFRDKTQVYVQKRVLNLLPPPKR